MADIKYYGCDPETGHHRKIYERYGRKEIYIFSTSSGKQIPDQRCCREDVRRNKGKSVNTHELRRKEKTPRHGSGKNC